VGIQWRIRDRLIGQDKELRIADVGTGGEERRKDIRRKPGKYVEWLG